MRLFLSLIYYCLKFEFHGDAVLRNPRSLPFKLSESIQVAKSRSAINFKKFGLEGGCVGR